MNSRFAASMLILAPVLGASLPASADELVWSCFPSKSTTPVHLIQVFKGKAEKERRRIHTAVIATFKEGIFADTPEALQLDRAQGSADPVELESNPVGTRYYDEKGNLRFEFNLADPMNAAIQMNLDDSGSLKTISAHCYSASR
jgi:hypothetical protein